MITPEQCRAARGLLNWTQTDLSERCGLSAVSIRAFEKGGNARASNLQAIRAAMEAAGVTFIDDDEASKRGGAGVRLSEPAK